MFYTTRNLLRVKQNLDPIIQLYVVDKLRRNMKTWILAVLCAVGLVAIGGLLGAVFSTEGYGDR